MVLAITQIAPTELDFIIGSGANTVRPYGTRGK